MPGLKLGVVLCLPVLRRRLVLVDVHPVQLLFCRNPAGCWAGLNLSLLTPQTPQHTPQHPATPLWSGLLHGECTVLLRAKQN